MGSAWVTLHVHHGTPFKWTNGPVKNWDLVENGFDANGLFLNPVWGWQINGGHLNPEGSNDPACYPGCSSQNPTYDNPSNKWFQIPNRLFAKVCQDTPIYNPLPGLAMSGHRNWFDATYTGNVQWVEHSDAVSGDDDYNMRLLTPHNLQGAVDAAGTTAKNQEDPFHEGDIGVEFDSDETIDKFTENRFWTTFHTAVDAENGIADRLIDGHEAIVTGLVGIDEMHSPHVEIHPVHALAIRLDPPTSVDVSDDRWAIFVRNWGDEGECSSNQHFLDRNDITLQLPAPSGATPGAVATLNPSTNFFHLGATVANEFYSGSEGAFVTFHLLTGTNQGFAYGELDLNWTGTPGVARASMQRHAKTLDRLLRTLRHQRSHTRPMQGKRGTSRLTANLDAPDPEEALQDIWDSMTPEQQQTAISLYTMLYQRPVVNTVPLQWHVATTPPGCPPLLLQSRRRSIK